MSLDWSISGLTTNFRSGEASVSIENHDDYGGARRQSSECLMIFCKAVALELRSVVTY